jgi:hypothetical protein
MMDRCALLSFVVVTWMCVTSCGEMPRNDWPVTRRDSAGVRIVDNREPVWTSITAWTVASSPSLVISDATHPTAQTPLDPIAVWFTSDGEIVVADGNQNGWDAFLVYSRRGEFRRRVSRAGAGPGEFGQLLRAFPYRGDSLLGFDTAGQSVALFGVDGGFSREVRLPSLGAPSEPAAGTYPLMGHVLGAFSDGRILYTSLGVLALAEPGFAWYERELVRLSPMATVEDSLGLARAYQMHWSGTDSRMAPFTPSTAYAVVDSTFMAVSGESLEVREFNRDGALLRIIRHPLERAAVTAADREDARSWWLDALRIPPTGPSQRRELVFADMDGWGYPDYKPAASDVVIDDAGYVWVEQFRWILNEYVAPNPTSTLWSVFDPTGRWLGVVEVPARFILHAVQNARIIGVSLDETDLASIHVLDLDRSS